jgi:hypothetical protein
VREEETVDVAIEGGRALPRATLGLTRLGEAQSPEEAAQLVRAVGAAASP